MTRGRQIVREYDRKIAEGGDVSLIGKANGELVKMAKDLTDDVLTQVLHEASVRMKNGYSRADN